MSNVHIAAHYGYFPHYCPLWLLSTLLSTMATVHCSYFPHYCHLWLLSKLLSPVANDNTTVHYSYCPHYCTLWVVSHYYPHYCHLWLLSTLVSIVCILLSPVTDVHSLGTRPSGSTRLQAGVRCQGEVTSPGSRTNQGGGDKGQRPIRGEVTSVKDQSWGR